MASPVATEKNVVVMVCPICQKKLPDFTEEGKHNFCPSSTQDGGIINICMECKMKEVTENWRWQM